jgi:O-antigen/teichoic acid export membrane protein
MYLQLAASAAVLGGNVVLGYGVSVVLTRLLGLEGFGI